MADNLTLNPGSGGAVLATDEITSVHYQIIKLAFGALDSVTVVDTSNPVPVDLRLDNLPGNLDVVVAAALPAGTNNIGDVDVLSLIPGTGATNLGKAEDAAHVTGDTGVMALAVRQDTPANLSGASGDYEPLQVSAGRVWASATIDAAIPAGDNNIGNVDIVTVPAPLNVTGSGTEAAAIRVTIATDSTGVLSIDDNGGAITVDNGGTFAVQVDAALPAGTNNIGDVDVLTLPNVTIGTMANLTESLVDDAAFTPATSRVVPIGFEFDDVTPDSVDEGDIGAARMSANRNIYTTIRDAAGNERGVNVTAANRLSVDGSGVTQPVSGTVTSVGDVAHDGVDSGNPVKIGAVARTTNPTAVGDADRVNIYADKLGRLVMYSLAPRERIFHNRIALTSTTETVLIAASGTAGIFRDIVDITISNEAATEVRVDIRDSSTGTIRYSVDLAPDGGGIAKTFRVPLTQAAANNNWTAQLSAAVSTVYITAIAVEGP